MAPLPTYFCVPLRKRMTPRGYILYRSWSEAARENGELINGDAAELLNGEMVKKKKRRRQETN